LIVAFLYFHHQLWQSLLQLALLCCNVLAQPPLLLHATTSLCFLAMAITTVIVGCFLSNFFFFFTLRLFTVLLTLMPMQPPLLHLFFPHVASFCHL